MAERQEQHFPEWAEQEQARDLAWIRENLHVFWPAAQMGYEAVGRGALGVDTTQTFAHEEGVGHPIGYLDQATIKQRGAEDTLGMIREYDPTCEFVMALLKPHDLISSYCISVTHIEPRENLGNRI